MYEVLTSFYAELLREAVTAYSLRMSAEHLARLLIFSLRGIKDLAEDAESMHRLLIQKIDLFLAAINVDDASGRRPRAGPASGGRMAGTGMAETEEVSPAPKI